MVMTHAGIKKQKQKVLNVEQKEENPRRLHMSKAEALADNARLREIKEKTEAYRRGLESSGNGPTGDDRPEVDDSGPGHPEMTSTQLKISRLEEQKAKLRGPGSKARKAELQEEIDALKIRAA